jgi:hypothetical protein
MSFPTTIHLDRRPDFVQLTRLIRQDHVEKSRSVLLSRAGSQPRELIVSGPDVMVYMYTDPTRLNRIVLRFLPYRPFGLTGCLPAARSASLLRYGVCIQRTICAT